MKQHCFCFEKLLKLSKASKAKSLNGPEAGPEAGVADRLTDLNLDRRIPEAPQDFL